MDFYELLGIDIKRGKIAQTTMNSPVRSIRDRVKSSMVSKLRGDLNQEVFRNRSTSINQNYEDKLPRVKDRFEPQTFDDSISEMDQGGNKIVGLQTVI